MRSRQPLRRKSFENHLLKHGTPLTHLYPQESNQSTIELKDDNPTALEGLIRWLYTLPVVVRNHEPWAFWLAVRITADKYLASDLSKKAFENFWYATLEIKTAEKIFEILETIERDMGHDAMLVEAAGRLRRRWLHSLLKLPAFRARLVDDTDLMLDLLEHLSGKLASRGTGDPFLTPKRGEHGGLPNRMKTFLCDDHKKAVFYPINDLEKGGSGRCSYCSVLRGVVGLPLVEGTWLTLAEKSWPPQGEHAEMSA